MFLLVLPVPNHSALSDPESTLALASPAGKPDPILLSLPNLETKLQLAQGKQLLNQGRSLRRPFFFGYFRPKAELTPVVPPISAYDPTRNLALYVRNQISPLIHIIVKFSFQA